MKEVQVAAELNSIQVKAQHLEALGKPLGDLYDALWQDVVWLHVKWNQYVELYGTKDSRLELLNESAPLFFRIVQDTLWENILLHIARLTDPAKTGAKGNLSVPALPDAISNGEINAQVVVLIGEALEKTKFCRDWRNRRIAHRDLQLALADHAEPLLPASRAMVREALASIANVLNAVSHHYMKSFTPFDQTVVHDDSVDLIYVLHDGLRAARERESRIERGEHAALDVETHDL